MAGGRQPDWAGGFPDTGVGGTAKRGCAPRPPSLTLLPSPAAWCSQMALQGPPWLSPQPRPRPPRTTAALVSDVTPLDAWAHHAGPLDT